MSTISIELEPDVASAIVLAVTNALRAEGQELGRFDRFDLPETLSPGDLFKLREHCTRIARLTAVNDQLRWRAWGGLALDVQQDTFAATEAIALEISAILRQEADELASAARDCVAPERDLALSSQCARASRVLAAAVGLVTA